MLIDSQLADAFSAHAPLRVGKTYGCATALLIAEWCAASEQTTLVLTASVAENEILAGELAYFLGGTARFSVFPDLEVLPYDSFSPHQDLISERLRILSDLRRQEPVTVLTAASTLLSRLPPKEYLLGRAVQLHEGQSLAPERLKAQLHDAGYLRVTQVSGHGEYAVRGSLLDFFPAGWDCPVRVDFFDNQIESLREFETETQISTGKIPAVDSLPAREFPMDEDGIREFRNNFRQRFEGNPADVPVYSAVSEGRLAAGIEAYLPLFHTHTASIWDYLPADTRVICCGPTDGALKLAWNQIEERYKQVRLDPERPPLLPHELFHSIEHTAEQIDRFAPVQLDRNEIPAELCGPRDINLDVAAPPIALINRHDSEPVAGLKRFITDGAARILLITESPGRREVLNDLLRQHRIAPSPSESWSEFTAAGSQVAAAVAPVDRGVILNASQVAILAEREIFGETPKRRRKRRRVQDPEALINDLTNLRPGAPVIHAEHGIGRYTGLSNLDIDDALTEFLTLEYAGGDRLYVPVSSLHLISRYTGASPDQAPLHRLGSDQWRKAQRRAAEKIRDAAAELLDIYARRASRPGRSFEYDPVELENFAAGFPFATTEDQENAINDVVDDLVASSAMDRLVCGDVGFGKTEVALRAAFVVAATGRQVALLVPTTLLAQQHCQTFTDRFAEWPINVDVLSRFRNAADSRQLIDGLASGRVDIVIGTHRLLQKNVAFKNLGLVIVDEEHRFGVRHKERLKALRNEVDILTLTATPIPRTLNMALGGLRELSLIATPPESRLSIKTFVSTWNDTVIREACLRELNRGGQVYFVHNRIEDIQKVADQLRELVDEGEIEVAHGQMRESELERIMLDFYHRRFHILVCTAIIESGLDVPTANTIIVNRADRFGLAQLHQLRGRVGRSHHQAFAYLLAPPHENMTADAVKRLEAVESLEDLGAGFVLATHDLEIRGAGELLGEDQSGQIQEIGFALYNEILTRTVEALRSGREPGMDVDLQQGPEINLHVPALLPDDYMPDVHLRLVHYKRIASAPGETELRRLQVELIDRFGILPPPTKNLFRLTALRQQAAPLGIVKLDLGDTGGFVEFAAETAVDPRAIVGLIESDPETYRIDRGQRLRMSIETDDTEKRFDFADQLFRALAQKAGDDGTLMQANQT